MNVAISSTQAIGTEYPRELTSIASFIYLNRMVIAPMNQPDRNRHEKIRKATTTTTKLYEKQIKHINITTGEK